MTDKTEKGKKKREASTLEERHDGGGWQGAVEEKQGNSGRVDWVLLLLKIEGGGGMPASVSRLTFHFY